MPAQLWRAVKASGGAEAFGERSGPSVYICKGWGAVQKAGAVTADSAESSEFGRVFSYRAAELGFTREKCDSLGPGAKLRKVAEGACSLDQINQFSQAAAQLNTPKNRDSRLRSAASGIR